MIIDTHAHIYSEDLETYPAIDEPLRPPPGTGTPDGLQEAMRSSGVDRAMLVQTTTFYQWDNTFVRDTGAAAGDWARSVVTLDPEDPHSPDVLFALCERANARALRTYPVRHQNYDHPGNRRLIAAARDLGMTVNSLAWRIAVGRRTGSCSGGLPGLQLRVRPLPRTVNRPRLRRQAAARHRTGVVSQPARQAHVPAHGNAVRNSRSGTCTARAGSIIDAYGPDRCVWGSDYPTELWCPNVTYAQHLELFQEHLGLSESEQQAILGGTAERLWFS